MGERYEKYKRSWNTIWPQQVNCPCCKNIIITPQARCSQVQLADDPNLSIERDGKCVRCGQIVTFKVYGDPERKPEVRANGPKPKLPENDCGIFHCKRIGLAGTTDIFFKFDKDTQLWEARQGFALFGTVNNEASIGACPFDENFRDNYGVGRGATKEEAQATLEKELDKIHEGLWAELAPEQRVPPTPEEVQKLEDELTKKMLKDEEENK